MQRASHDKGTTMLETIMYISLLIVLGGSIASYVGRAFTRYKTGRVAQQVIDLKKAIVQYTAASPDYSNLRLEAEDSLDDSNGMMEDRALPLDLKSGRHALGGKIRIGPASALRTTPNANDSYMFYILFENVPQNSCAEIVTQGQFYGDGSDMDTLIINNKAWRFPFSLFSADNVSLQAGIPSKINLTTALDACYKKLDNQITWIFS